MFKVLHVGCGPKTLSGMPPFFQDGNWEEVRLDIDEAVKPDVIGTMTDMSAVETGSVQAIFSSHNVEHPYPHEVPIAFAEFRRVLGHGGFALITCPDLQAVAQLVAEGKLLEPAYQSGMGPISPLDILYGHRASIARGNHYMAHRSGFTLTTLIGSLNAAGFVKAAGMRRPANFDLWAFALTADLPEAEIQAQAARMFPG